jgi:MoaA/NifB/PqqE/SkfB family radical SAM enzyme
MQAEQVVHGVTSVVGPKVVAGVGAKVLRFAPVRRGLVHYVDRRMEGIRALDDTVPPQVIRDKAAIGQALMYSISRAIEHSHAPETVVRGLLRSLALNAFLQEEHYSAGQRFRDEHDGHRSPGFVVISPGKLCNLHCKGCYASSGTDDKKLDWKTFDRIITETKTLWGTGFVVISGGEPMAYSSGGLGVLDAAAKHPDVFFLMYTNGTLINKHVAARMAEMGNITPAISVEGWEERTDARRGKGVYQRVLTAMANLREAGVPFGISLTATCENCEEILSDEFLEFFFEEQGAMYGWLFQYMPIGRGITLDMLPTPEQRAWMWRRSWQVIREKRYFLPDFWNSGTATKGCISAGRQGGYFYIDWNGKVTPCVFIPYSPVNINDAYREGKTLNDILAFAIGKIGMAMPPRSQRTARTGRCRASSGITTATFGVSWRRPSRILRMRRRSTR